MNPQVTYRKFGTLAAIFTAWLMVHQVIAFSVAVVMASTSSSYHDEPATIMYFALSGFGLIIALVSLIFSGLNLFKDPKGKWLGVVSMLLTLGTLTATIIIAVISGIDTWA